MILGIITLSIVLITWITAVTTEAGQHITVWTAHFLGVLVLIALMMGSILLSLNYVLKEIGA